MTSETNTTATGDAETPLHLRKAIASDDHNAGMDLVTGVITGWTEVSPQLCRVTVAAEEVAHDPTWRVPNVAVRLRLGAGEDQLTRIYTVRSCTPESSTIELDVVRHGGDSPMMIWLAQLAVGQTIDFVGPRPHMQIPDLRGRRAAVFADGTAIPALITLLEQAPADLRGVAFIATDDTVAFDEIPSDAGLDLQRTPPGRGFGEQLASLVDPAGHVVWGAGERDEMRAVRSFFRTEHGVAKDDVAVFGYWKRGTSNTRIDEVRLAAYQNLLARGGTVGELEDLDLDI